MELDDVLAEAFRLLARGVADRRSPFHTPTVVSVADDGAPDPRTVVLRAFDAGERVLTFHTDARAAKVGQLRARPQVALHVYDAAHKIQLRIEGGAAVHHDDDRTRAAWRAATAGSRATYRVAQPPGSAVSDPSDVDALGLDEDAAYAWFALVRVRIDSLEWLHLAASGHRRARFAWTEAEQLAEWLAP